MMKFRKGTYAAALLSLGVKGQNYFQPGSEVTLELAAPDAASSFMPREIVLD